MRSAQRVAIKGWAWRTPLGSSIENVTRKLLAGERAVRTNTRFDAASYLCTVASSIKEDPAVVRQRRFLRRMGLFALEVAREALCHSGLLVGDRVGLFFGYGGLRAHWGDMMPAFEHQQSDGNGAWERGMNLLHPYWMLQHLSNNAHALAAEELRVRGEGATFAGANAGAQALAAAIRALEAGAIDTALVVGYDSFIEPETLVDLAARGMLTTQTENSVTAPYDRTAQGFVPGEAAASVVLQRVGSSDGRDLAYLQAADGADGEAAAPRLSTITNLLANLTQGDTIIDGAGWAQPAQDNAERIALAKFAGDDTMLCCTMSALGQLGAAAPLVQAIALTEQLCLQMLAPIAGLQHAAAGLLRPLTSATPINTRSALAISMGTPGLAGAIRIDVA
jgi:3-oxoacyl-(acyl-carrier-protein) synthase